MIKLITSLSWLAAVACCAGGAWAAQPLGCVIEPERVAEVGTPVIGVIESLHVERGARVRKGQVLAVLRADVERASLAVAVTRSQADADVQAALASFEFMRDKQARSEELVRKNFISRQALEQTRAEARIAEQKLAQTREQQLVSQRERELAQAQLAMRSIKAPFDGVVIDRYVAVGERVETRALFRIANVNPLRVELMIPAALYGTVKEGTLLEVTPELPNMRPLKAKVALVDSVMDAPSNTFRARAALANPDGRLPSGVRCRVALPGAPVRGGVEASAEARRPTPSAAAPAPVRPQAARRAPVMASSAARDKQPSGRW
jgi:RND family efflux transporter MFP subunit